MEAPHSSQQVVVGGDVEQLVAALPVGVYVCEAPSGTLRLWNRRAVELFGREPMPGELEERFCGSLRLFRQDGSPLAEAGGLMADVLRTGEPRTEDVVIHRGEQPPITVRIQISPLQDPNGRITGAVGVLQELTGQARVNAALWLSEARYRTIVEDQPDLVCRFLADGTLTFVNEAYCEYFGIRREEVIGRRYLPVVHADDHAQVQALVESVSPSNPVVSIENRVLRSDGAVRWTHWTNRALYDDGGRLLEIQSAGRDITERKQAEEDAARLAAIVASAESAIFGMTLDGTVTSWNRAAERMFGYPAADAVGQPISIIIPPDRSQEGAEILSRLRRGETVRHFETERVTRSGRRIPVSLTVSPIRDASGRAIGISKIARDITDRKRLDAERERAVQRASEALAAAEEASRLKDEFLAIVSHELRTPLNAMLGWARMLRDGSVPAESVPKALDTIERNARMQAQLVEDLLDVSRIVSGKLTLRVGPVDLGSVIQAAVETVRPAATNKDIDIRVDLRDPDTVVFGDPGRLQQAIWNLLANAVKFTPKNGRVDVELNRADSEAMVTVRDTGSGIATEALPFIFDRFRQADTRTTRAHGGLGLGLTIVQYFVEAHGGTVRAESAGAEQGATFTITLPLRAGSARSATVRAEAAGGADLTDRRVLVVDDDPDARDVMRAILERSGAAVTTAASVMDAVAAARAASPHVLIGDIGMPGQDGYDLIRAIRALPGLERLPAVALTAYADRHHQEAALRAGYDVHLRKPIDPDVICRAIVELCGARRSS